MAYPVSDSYATTSGGVIAGGRFWLPDWAPAAGEIKTISKPAGYYGTNAGATLAEINPNYQWWDTDPASNQPYGGVAQGFSMITAQTGACLNTDTRQYFRYGAGHSAMNVMAPNAFDLNDLKWKWLDVPLPFDAYQSVSIWDQAHVEAVYPPEQLNFQWGDLDGGWSGWPEALRRPGIIQPIPCHSRAHSIHIPATKYGNANGAYFKCDLPTGVTSAIAGSTISSHYYDFDVGLWHRGVNQPFQSSSSTNGRGVAHDPVSNKIILFGAGGTASPYYYIQDVATETWTTRTASLSVKTCTDTGGHLVHLASGLHIAPAARDASNNPATIGPDTGVTFEFWACPASSIVGTGSFAPQLLNVSVVSTWPLNASGKNSFMGWTQCPVDDCLYCVSGNNGSAKYWRLAPPVGAVTVADYLTGTWTLTEHTFDTGAFETTLTLVTPYNSNQWDDRSRAFIWHAGGLTDPVMAWRPHGI